MRTTPDQVADHLAGVAQATEAERRQSVEKSAMQLAKDALWRWLHMPRNRRERRGQQLGGHGRKAHAPRLTAYQRRSIARARRIAAACGDYSLV